MNNNLINLRILQVEPLRYVAKTCAGKEIITEPSGLLGGKDEYPNPMEYFIASIGTCIAIKTHINLAKVGNEPDFIEIEMKCTKSKIPPEILEDINIIIILTGYLNETIVNRAIQDTMTLSCPVNVMVSRIARVAWDFRLKRPDN